MVKELSKEGLTEEQKAEIYQRYSKLSQENIYHYGVRDEVTERELLETIQSMGNYHLDGSEGLNLMLYNLAGQTNNSYLAVAVASVNTFTEVFSAVSSKPNITRIEWIGGNMASLANTPSSGVIVKNVIGANGLAVLGLGIDIANDWVSFDGVNFVKAAAADITKAGVGALGGVAGSMMPGGPVTGIVVSNGVVYFLDQYAVSKYKESLERAK